MILGYQGEPYLRFDKSGVFQNMRSPATYVNRFRGTSAAASRRRRTEGRARVGAGRRGASFAWRDHRIYWARKEPRPA